MLQSMTASIERLFQHRWYKLQLYCLVLKLLISMTQTTKTSKRIAMTSKQAIKVCKKSALVNVCNGAVCTQQVLKMIIAFWMGTLLGFWKEQEPSMNWLNRNMTNKVFLEYKEDLCKKIGYRKGAK